MEPDLKDTIKKLEEAKNRQEKIERMIILLSGFLVIIIFSIIGINIYTDKEETVSEPEVTIVSKEVKKTQLISEETVPPPSPTLPKTSVTDSGTTKENVKTEKKTEVKKSQISQRDDTEKKEIGETTDKIKNQINTTKKTSFPSGFYIQVGAFSSKKKAEKFIQEINLKNAQIKKEGELYKILIGSFKNKKEAYSFMKEKNIKGFIRKL